MWQTTSKPLFIFFPSFLFLSASPSFSFVMQPEKAVSSEKEKGSKRETVEGGKKETERWWWCWDDYMWAGLNDFSPSDSSLLIIWPNSLPPSMENIPLQIFLTKRVALCRTIGEGLPCLTWEHNYSSYPVRIMFQVSKCDCILYLQSKMWSSFSSAAHAHEVNTIKNPCNTILHSFIYHIKANSTQNKPLLQ